MGHEFQGALGDSYASHIATLRPYSKSPTLMPLTRANIAADSNNCAIAKLGSPSLVLLALPISLSAPAVICCSSVITHSPLCCAAVTIPMPRPQLLGSVPYW